MGAIKKYRALIKTSLNTEIAKRTIEQSQEGYDDDKNKVYTSCASLCRKP